MGRTPLSVILDWYGCSTFRMRIQELHVFLDAYIDRADNAPGTGLRADDIERCDWIVVGHSHFDHIFGAERIAANTGARIIASYESVRILERAGVPLEQMICVAGGETIELGRGVRVTVYPSQHSCVWSHGQMAQPDAVCVGDLGVPWHEQQRRLEELVKYLTTQLAPEATQHIVGSQQVARGDGGALVYLFETPDGSVLFQDTSGHWSGLFERLPRPDVAILAAAGRGNIDGQPIQGSLAEFVGREAALLSPARVVLGHHDDWLPGFSVDTDVAPIRKELERVVPGTGLLELGYLDATEILPVR
jgi:L-ascorbate metabolism protein UlaG (beta-lactamase superfamily)